MANIGNGLAYKTRPRTSTPGTGLLRSREGESLDETNEPAAPRKEKSTRLSININRETAEALKEIAERRGISYTEAVRRAFAIYKLIEDETLAGHRIQIVDGQRVKEVVLLLG